MIRDLNDGLPKTNHFFAFRGKELIVRRDGMPIEYADLALLSSSCGRTDFFEEYEFDLCALGLDNIYSLPKSYLSEPIRQVIFRADEDDVLRISRAKALLEWRSATRFCGRCGTSLIEHHIFSARECPNCRNIIFPRIEPCIIVLVSRTNSSGEEEILLARHAQRNQDVYTCLAGFMEAGESAEHAVGREIFEETGLHVRNIRYFGSQSWPFPSQLMIAFTAEYESGEIHLQKDEISDAQWFKRDKCPDIPPPGSIAYRLINNLR